MIAFAMPDRGADIDLGARPQFCPAPAPHDHGPTGPFGRRVAPA
jgi:hypothetical protein